MVKFWGGSSACNIAILNTCWVEYIHHKVVIGFKKAPPKDPTLPTVSVYIMGLHEELIKLELKRCFPADNRALHSPVWGENYHANFVVALFLLKLAFIGRCAKLIHFWWIECNFFPLSTSSEIEMKKKLVMLYWLPCNLPRKLNDACVDMY